jgi:hypothetical protein
MKAFPIPLATLAVSGAQAQRSYVGLYVGGVTSSSGVTPFGGVQVGGPVADNVELRLAGLTILLATVFRLDVLYTQPLAETLRGYAGGGGSVFQAAFAEGGGGRDGRALSVHATAGVEADVGFGVGLFAEVQPTYVLSAPDGDVEILLGNEGAATFFGTLAVGVNVHF